MPPDQLEQDEFNSRKQWDSVALNGIVESWTWSFVALGGLVVFLCILFYSYIQFRKRKGVLTKGDLKEFEMGRRPPHAVSIEFVDFDAIEGVQLTDYPYNKDVELSKEKFKFGSLNLIGVSRHCKVYHGKVSCDNKEHDVAVKVLKSHWKRNAVLNFLTEVKILSNLTKHPNICSIVAAFTSDVKHGSVYLGSELCLGGSLELYLHRIKERKVEVILNTKVDQVLSSEEDNEKGVVDVEGMMELKEFIRFALEIASGMEFLALRKVVHADICTRNVLLDANKTVKITNICAPKRINMFSSLVKQNFEPVRWQWLAYESLMRRDFTLESDVWSFGVTLFEIFSLGRMPYPSISWTNNFTDRLSAGLRISRPALATRKLYELMLECWKLHPKSRPSITSFRQFLLKLLNQDRYNLSRQGGRENVRMSRWSV